MTDDMDRLKKLITQATIKGLEAYVDGDEQINAALLGQAAKWYIHHHNGQAEQQDEDEVGGLIDAIMNRKQNNPQLPAVSDDDDATTPTDHDIHA